MDAFSINSCHATEPGREEQPRTRAPFRPWTQAPQPTRPISSRKSVQRSSSLEEGSSESGATPLFRVVEDPRAERRRLKAIAEAAERGEEYVESTTKDYAESTKKAAKASHKRANDLALPNVDGKMLVVSLPNGAKIADYEWFGIYDQCQQVFVAICFLQINKYPPLSRLN